MAYSASRSHRRPAVACTIALSLMVTACASNTPTGGSQADRANGNTGTTVAQGALAGAALGAVGGALLGGRNRGAAAAMGAVAGGALGAGAGYMVARGNTSQGHTEDTLAGQIKASQQFAYNANVAAANARKSADQARAQSRILQSQYQSGTISAGQFRQQMTNSTAAEQTIRQQIGTLQAEQAGLRTEIASAGSKAGPLQQSYQSNEAAVRSLQDSLSDQTKALAAVPAA